MPGIFAGINWRNFLGNPRIVRLPLRYTTGKLSLGETRSYIRFYKIDNLFVMAQKRG
jgi:hypothetical protein